MNRIFHARIAWNHCLALLLFTFLVIIGFLNRSGLLALAGMLLLVLLVERLIHTTYTITPQGVLIIDRGRFSRSKTIPLADISAVERQSACMGCIHYVLITYGNGQRETALPVKEEEFMACLRSFKK